MAQISPGQLLIASVTMSDQIFDETVVMLLDVNDPGTVGVVLNKVADLELDSVLPQWTPLMTPPMVLFDGGPVSQQGAICLARPIDEEEPPGWRPLIGGLGLLNLDTPVELAMGAYRDLRVFAGYAGWAEGQLEAELELGMWYQVDSEPSDAFDSDPTSLWRRVLRRQGGELALLSTWTSSPEHN